MRGYNLLEMTIALFIASLILYMGAFSGGPSWDKEAVYQTMVRAKWASMFQRRKIKLTCSGKDISGSERVHLRLCQASCNPVVFHPSGYVTPAGSLYLLCGERGWKFVISALGRIRVLEFRAKKTVGDEEN